MKNIINLCICTLSVIFLSCSGSKSELEEFQSSLWKANDNLPIALFDYELGGQFTSDTTFVEGRWSSEKRNKKGNSYKRITDSIQLEIYVADNIIDHITYEINDDPLVVEPIFVKILQKFNPLFKEDAEYGVKIYEDGTTEMRIKYGESTKTFNGKVTERLGYISILLRPIDPNNGEFTL